MNTKKIEQIKKIKSPDAKLERVGLAEMRDMVYEKFRTNLRILRASKGQSGCEASDAIGLKNGRRVIELEYGKTLPTIDDIRLIAKYYEVSIDELLDKDAVITFK